MIEGNLTDVDRNYLKSLPWLQEKLPLEVAGGKITITSLSTVCMNCGTEINSNRIKVNYNHGNDITTIEGYGLCPNAQCTTITSFNERHYPDETILFLHDGVWYKKRWNNKIPWWDLLSKFKKLFK